jgi:hypothetical protein
MIEGATTAQLGAVLPVHIASYCKVQESFDLRLSVNEHDRTCKVARAYVELATHLAERLFPSSLKSKPALLSAPSKAELSAQEALF